MDWIVCSQCSSSVSRDGCLVVLGLKILPFLSFYVLETHLRHILWKSILWNICATVLSLVLSCQKDWPYGPTLILILGAGYGGALVYSRINFSYLWRGILLFGMIPMLYAQRSQVVTSSRLLKHIVEILLPKSFIVETLSENNHFHHVSYNARNLIK